MDIGEALIQIADKLGTTGEHLLKVFIEAQVGIGYINIISTIVWIFLTILICRAAYHYINKDRSYDSKSCAMIVCFATCMFLVFVILYLKDEVIRIMYPEYTGIKELITTLSDVVGK